MNLLASGVRDLLVVAISVYLIVLQAHVSNLVLIKLSSCMVWCPFGLTRADIHICIYIEMKCNKNEVTSRGSFLNFFFSLVDVCLFPGFSSQSFFFHFMFYYFLSKPGFLLFVGPIFMQMPLLDDGGVQVCLVCLVVRK